MFFPSYLASPIRQSYVRLRYETQTPKLRNTIHLKRLHKKELPSRPVGLNFYGLDALSLSQLAIAGTKADKNWEERKPRTFLSPFPQLQILKGEVSSF